MPVDSVQTVKAYANNYAYSANNDTVKQPQLAQTSFQGDEFVPSEKKKKHTGRKLLGLAAVIACVILLIKKPWKAKAAAEAAGKAAEEVAAGAGKGAEAATEAAVKKSATAIPEAAEDLGIHGKTVIDPKTGKAKSIYVDKTGKEVPAPAGRLAGEISVSKLEKDISSLDARLAREKAGYADLVKDPVSVQARKFDGFVKARSAVKTEVANAKTAAKNAAKKFDKNPTEPNLKDLYAAQNRLAKLENKLAKMDKVFNDTPSYVKQRSVLLKESANEIDAMEANLKKLQDDLKKLTETK